MKHISVISKTPQQAQLSTNAKYVALLEIMESVVSVNRASAWKALGLPGADDTNTTGGDTGTTGGGLGDET